MSETSKAGALWRVLRIAGSAILLGVILSRVELHRVVSVLAESQLGLLLVAASLHVLGIGIWTVRWRALLSACDCEVPLRTLSHIILVGMFANNFLPTSFGGDAYRGVAVEKDCPGLSRAMASVLVDRLLGLVALLALAALALVIGLGDEIPTGTLWSVLLGGAAFLALLSVLLATGRWRWLVGKIPTRAISERLDRLMSALASYGSARNALIAGLLWSVAMQLVVILQFYLFGVSLGWSVSLLVFAVFVPVIFVLLMLPISIGGLGVREGLFVVFFARAGVPAADALALSLLFFVSSLVLSLYGGYILMISDGESRRWLIPVFRKTSADP